MSLSRWTEAALQELTGTAAKERACERERDGDRWRAEASPPEELRINTEKGDGGGTPAAR